jgi:hypothetical protein
MALVRSFARAAVLLVFFYGNKNGDILPTSDWSGDMIGNVRMQMTYLPRKYNFPNFL